MICSAISLAVLSAFGHVTKGRLNFVSGSTQLYSTLQSSAVNRRQIDHQPRSSVIWKEDIGSLSGVGQHTTVVLLIRSFHLAGIHLNLALVFPPHSPA